MIFTEQELKERIGSKEPQLYLKDKAINFTKLGKGDKQIFYIKDKLEFKCINTIEEVLKQDYKITDVATIDKTIKLTKELYVEDKYINVEESIIGDRDLVNLLVEEGILTITEYNNYKVSVSYKFLAKVLEV
ncbi:MAG: hypothetical protein ACRCW0_08955 [Clostridium sp.]